MNINILRSFLITSEILKFSALIENNNDPLIITSSKNQKHRIDDIVIRPNMHWISNIGAFVCGNSGESTIYNTPQESELSKAPVILTLYASFNFNSDFNSKQFKELLSCQKKLWLLRQPPVMGG
jgi:hypothetical protein